MLKVYEYRLYPTKSQIEKLQWILDKCRELYNAALQERRDAWKMCRVNINYYQQSAQLPEIKEIRPEYKEIGAHVLQNVLRRVDNAYKAFFRRVKNGKKPGYPRFQGKNRYDSFCFPDHSNWKLEKNRITINNVGSIKVKMHREIEGKIKTVTIKREEHCWYVYFCCNLDEYNGQKTPYTDNTVGIDLGLYHFAALSSGDLIENPRHYRRAEKQLVKAQHAVSRRKRGSNRRRKAVQRLAKHHHKIRNQRKDFLHQWSHRLVNTYETIVFEDLEPSKMSKAPEPKQDKNGTYLPNGASQKAGLNKSILDAGWSTFIALCQSKAESAGVVQVVKVDPYKTSQVCSGCLHEGSHKDLSERTHTCEHCGLVLDRDINAACNILSVWQGLNLRPTKKLKKSKVARTEPSASRS